MTMGRVIILSAPDAAGEPAALALAGLGWTPVFCGRLGARLPDPPELAAAQLLVADLAGAASPAALVEAQSAADKLGLPLVCRIKAAEVAPLLEALPGLVLGRLWLDHWDAGQAARALAGAAPVLPAAGTAACRPFCDRLRDCEQRNLCEILRLIGRNLPDLIWAKDLDNRFLYVNQATCDKLLMCAGAEEALGRDDLFFAARERAAGHAHTFGEMCADSDEVVKRSGQPQVFLEEGLVRGRHLSLQVHKAPFRNERGELVGTVGAGRDVTAELATNRRLAESEQRYRAIIDNLEQGILVAQDGLVQFVSPWFARVFGLTPAMVVGQPLEVFVHPDDRAQVIENHRRRSAGLPAPSRYNIRIVGVDGRPRWVSLNAILGQWEGRPAAMGFVLDISEQLQAERELKASEQRLRTTFDQAAVGMCETDRKGRFQKVNQCLCRMLGQDEAALRGRSFLELAHPDEVGESLRLLDAALNGQSPDFVTEKRYRRPDGTFLEAQVTATLVRRPDGEPSHYFAVVRDIGERKAAEEALKLQEERFRTLVQNLPGLVYRCEVGMPWRVLYMSDGALGVTGRSAEDFLRQRVNFGQIILPEDLPLVEREVAAAVDERRPYQLEYRIIHPGGEVRWVYERGRALYDEQGEPQYLDGILLDVTRRKQAEIQRQLSEDKFTKAFKASPVWVSVTTAAEGRFLEVNEAFTATTGYTREEAIGRTSFDLGFWLNPERDRQPALEAFRRQGYFRNLETRMRYKDGLVHTMLWSVDPIEYEGQACFLNVLTDISDLKRAQEEKEALERQLRQSHKMEAVGTLAGGIAHDFNNLLAAITGYAELGLELAGQGRDNSADLRQVLFATERARRLVRQILTFSRRAESELRPLDLNHEAAETARMLERTIPKMIALRLELDPDLPPVNADPVQVNQILLNLAANAQDAMPEGGVLTIATRALRLAENLPLELETIPAGEYALLSVTDTGHGIAPETCQHIFEPFFTTKGVGKGTGLGLATVFGVVKAHHGHIVCASAPDHGSRFDIYLPALARGAAPPEPAGREAAPAPGGAETILVVDDEPGLVSVARRSLESQGYRVLTAHSGEQALELFRGAAQRVDLVLMDLGMPGMGGARCLRELTGHDPSVRVVITTGYAPDTLADPDLAAAAGYLAKPYRRADLLAAVRRALDARHT